MRRHSGEAVLTKPSRILRTFLYLDSDQVVNALPTVQGGAVEDLRRTIVREKGGNLGVKLPLWVASIDLGGKGSKRIEEQLTLKQTTESALTMLLEEVENKVTLEEDYDFKRLREGDLIEFKAHLGVLDQYETEPPRMPDEFPTLWRNWFERLFRPEDPDERQAYERMRKLGLGKGFVAYADAPRPSGARVLLNVKSKYVLVSDREDFSRGVTVVGQVTGVPLSDESIVVDSGELGAVARVKETAEPPLSSPIQQEAAMPVATLAPLCIYR